MSQHPYTVNESLGYLVNMVARAMSQALRKAFMDNEHDLIPEQWGLLAMLHEHDGHNQMELANLQLKDKTHITRMVDGLEKRGLVRRVQDDSDRRNNLIYITGEGEATFQRLLPIATALLRQAYQDLSSDEIQVLKSLLRKVHNNIHEPASP